MTFNYRHTLFVEVCCLRRIECSVDRRTLLAFAWALVLDDVLLADNCDDSAHRDRGAGSVIKLVDWTNRQGAAVPHWGVWGRALVGVWATNSSGKMKLWQSRIYSWHCLHKIKLGLIRYLLSRLFVYISKRILSVQCRCNYDMNCSFKRDCVVGQFNWGVISKQLFDQNTTNLLYTSDQ